MSLDAIQAALSARIKTLAPALPIAWPNVAYVPVIGSPFLRVAFLTGDTQNPTLGTTFDRNIGIMQVTLHYPVNTGEGDPRRKADAVIALFPRGLTLTASGVDVHIDYTPSAAPGFAQDAWYILPVSISYRADIIA